MPRPIATVILVGFALVPAAARAQVPDPPRAELGVQVSAQTGERGAPSWSPRITFNLTPATALEVAADVRQPRVDAFATRTSGQWYALHLRQSLLQRGRLQVFGVVGAGAGETTQDFPGRTIGDRTGSITYPPSRYREYGFAAHVGAAAQYEAASRLAFRADVRATASERGGLRAMAGVVIPVGRFRAGDRPLRRATDSRAAGTWARVSPGREVWVVTSSGETLHGEVQSRSPETVVLAQRAGLRAVPVSDVVRVEARDGLGNGLAIGAASGAGATALLAGLYAGLLCDTDDCDAFMVGAFVTGAAVGAAVGGIVGGVIDSLIPGRQTLLSGDQVRVTPIASRAGSSIGVSIRWR